MQKLDGLVSIAVRISFVLGFALMILVGLEELVRFAGSTLLARTYSPETLLGLSVSLFVVAIALLLRQIREAMNAEHRPSR
jgi:hypothetical protein